MIKKKILVLTTSVFTDRMYQYSSFLDVLKREYSLEIWAKSFVSNPVDWSIKDVKVKPIPEVNPLRHRLNTLRRINEFAWMFRLEAKSIEINKKYKSDKQNSKFLERTGKMLHKLGLTVLFEKTLQSIILRYSNNLNIRSLLVESKPDYLVVSNPFWVEEPLIAIEAKKLKIPIISIIPSWDNITTKSRIIYNSDAYGVWSAIRIPELIRYYPRSKSKPQFTFGTPQYDIFSNKSFIISKDEFLGKYKLSQSLPIILYTLGSPLFIPSEVTVCIEFCKIAKEMGILDNYQVLVRPHPIKDFSEFIPLFKNIDVRIRVQEDVQTPTDQKFRYQDKAMLKNWVSTFFYSEIIIATSSTTILDASMFNKKHINISANLTSDISLDSFLRDVSFGFEHLQTLNRLGLLNNIKSFKELINQLKENILSQDCIPNNSKEIVLHLAEFENKGKYGEIFALKLSQIIQQLNN